MVTIRVNESVSVVSWEEFFDILLGMYPGRPIEVINIG